jgi:hypothetical protein
VKAAGGDCFGKDGGGALNWTEAGVFGGARVGYCFTASLAVLLAEDPMMDGYRLMQFERGSLIGFRLQ